MSFTNLKWMIGICFLCVQCTVFKGSSSHAGREKSFTEQAKSFRDSLKNKNLEVLSIEDRCGGCVSGIHQVMYIFWRQETSEYVRKFDNYSNYQNVELVQPFFYLLDTFDVESQELIAEQLLHFRYSQVNYYKEGLEVIDLKVSDGYLISYPTKDESVFLATIRSHLYELEHDPIYNW